MRKRMSIATLLPAALAAAATLALAASSAGAATPPSSDVTVPATAGKTASDTWSGTIAPGANPTSDCNGGTSTVDEHDVTVSVPTGAYSTESARFTFSITWTPQTPTEDTADEIITVLAPDGSEVGSGDTSNTTEQVTAQNLASGTYKVLACGFANALSTDYTGKLVVTTSSASATASLKSAPAHGLSFSAAVPADPQRDEAEPLMEIDRAGNIYTCGPTGFSNGVDYAQVSTDGGDQFHLLGTPPRGQQGGGGGGDCAMATAVQKNGQGFFQYAYAGLGPLTGFATATSPNDGHSLETAGPAGNGVTDKGAGADRQWITFVDSKTVLLIYNQQAPRNVVVQRSTDGGLTYGPVSAIGAPNPDFPGPIRYDPSHDVVYFPWDSGNKVYLSVSYDKGVSWSDCLVAVAPGAPAGFPTADADTQGDIYVAYGEKATYHTYMTALPKADVAKCDHPVAQDPTAAVAYPTNNPGFTTPVQVDRDSVRTTVFPWIAAGGAPGRVAVAFYGTNQDGNPNVGSFKAAWDVYVNQSLNALSRKATFSQVKATTHPFHYDSICLNGLGCDVSGGDRTLADFFAVAYNRRTGRLSVVFDRAGKKPNEAAGHIAITMVATQANGPSNGGGKVTSTRKVLRTSSPDPAGDALSSYSLTASTLVNPPTTNEPAADLRDVTVSPEVDQLTGKPVYDGGFTVTMKLADLSTTSLAQTLVDTGAQSLVWVFRFVDGYQSAAASARWNPAQGFTFGFNGYAVGQAPCVSGPQAGEAKCLVYPGDTAIQGKVDQARGTIALTVPRTLLKALGPDDSHGRPTEIAAQTGSRMYDATAFTMANTVSPTQNVQSFLYPLDNAPAFDFLIPASDCSTGKGHGTHKAGDNCVSQASVAPNPVGDLANDATGAVNSLLGSAASAASTATAPAAEVAAQTVETGSSVVGKAGVNVDPVGEAASQVLGPLP